MSETVLVTGGAGFIGSHLVDALLVGGHRVRVFDNLDPQVHGELREKMSWPTYGDAGAEYVYGDVRDRVALTRAMRKVDVVFHLAAAVGVGQSMYEIERYTAVNTLGTAVLLDILVNEKAINERVRKIIVASSMSVYGEGKYICSTHGVVYPRIRSQEQLEAREWDLECPVTLDNETKSRCSEALQPTPTDEEKPLHPTSVYAVTKRDQEEMCLSVGRAYRIPTVALRYFNTYGPRQALSNPYTGVAAIFCSRLLNGNPPVIFEDGMQSRDFVHVSDVVQANLLGMEQEEADYGVFNVGTGKVISVKQVADRLIRHLGSSVSAEIVEKSRAGDIRHCFPDLRCIEAIGYQADTDFEAAIPELVSWVQSQTATDFFNEANMKLREKRLVG